MLRKMRGQSTAEYAVVLGLVVAAVIGMQVYVRRGLNARIKAGTDAFTSAAAGTTITVGGRTATFASGYQYEPYYQESNYNTYQENIEQEHMGAGAIKKEKVSELTVRQSGGSQTQRGSADATARDATWY